MVFSTHSTTSYIWQTFYYSFKSLLSFVPNIIVFHIPTCNETYSPFLNRQIHHHPFLTRNMLHALAWYSSHNITARRNKVCIQITYSNKTTQHMKHGWESVCSCVDIILLLTISFISFIKVDKSFFHSLHYFSNLKVSLLLLNVHTCAFLTY